MISTARPDPPPSADEAPDPQARESVRLPDPARPIEIYHAATRLVDGLLALGSCWPGDEKRRRDLVHAAVVHGRLRRAQDRTEDVIFADFERLRMALWARIRESELPPGRASAVILGVDSAVSLAVAASLRGFYRDVIARDGGWPGTVERLIDGWLDQTEPRRP